MVGRWLDAVVCRRGRLSVERAVAMPESPAAPADVEAALTAAGFRFVVVVVDFGDKKWADYERVVKLVWSRWHLLV